MDGIAIGLGIVIGAAILAGAITKGLHMHGRHIVNALYEHGRGEWVREP